MPIGAQTTAIGANNALSFSSFGAEQTTFGTGFRGRTVLDGERYRDLDRRQSYYDSTQHDSKNFDFDGRIISGPRSAQPLLSGEKASWYVPLKSRRPSTPYRLGKIVVDSFTNLLFGEQRFPSIRVEGDSDAEDYAQTLSRVGRLPLRMIQARNLGGSIGSVGMSWCYYKGKPRFEVHNAKNVYVHQWDDRVLLVPKHASEVYQFYKVQWNGKEFANVFYWFRRDWTKDWDIVFKDVQVIQGKDPVWEPDLDKSVRHNDGVSHFTWIQNLPSEDIDGKPDYDGLYDQFDGIDLLFSVISRGATLNLDPTLKLKMDPDLVSRMGVKKGTDNALVVGEGGDAEYMELGGSSIEAGIKLLEMKRRAILETAQCIVPDPAMVAAQGVSSVAIKAMFAPMLGKADVLREQYGAGIERMLEPMVVVARKASASRVVVLDGDGGEQEVLLKIDLPQRVETDPLFDPVTGKATGESEIRRIDRNPGAGGEASLRWPAYFPPTPDDQSKVALTLQVATGGKAFMSKQTATEVSASTFGIEPAEEWRRVGDQHKEEQATTDAMFADADGSAGGAVSGAQELPPGSEAREPGEAAPASPSGGPQPPPAHVEGIKLTGTDLASIVTVNEARSQSGLGNLQKQGGQDDPDGFLTITEFKAKKAAMGDTRGAVIGGGGAPPKKTAE